MAAAPAVGETKEVSARLGSAVQQRALRLPQVFYNQGLTSLCRCVSYVRAEH